MLLTCIYTMGVLTDLTTWWVNIKVTILKAVDRSVWVRWVSETVWDVDLSESKGCWGFVVVEYKKRKGESVLGVEGCCDEGYCWWWGWWLVIERWWWGWFGWDYSFVLLEEEIIELK